MKNLFKKILTWLKAKYNACFFVGSTDILPPPLSKEEEREYFELIEKGIKMEMSMPGISLSNTTYV